MNEVGREDTSKQPVVNSGRGNGGRGRSRGGGHSAPEDNDIEHHLGPLVRMPVCTCVGVWVWGCGGACVCVWVCVCACVCVGVLIHCAVCIGRYLCSSEQDSRPQQDRLQTQQ